MRRPPPGWAVMVLILRRGVNMKKAFWLAGVTALALAQPASAGDTIKIGFVSTFSGPTAVIGKRAQLRINSGGNSIPANKVSVRIRSINNRRIQRCSIVATNQTVRHK